MIEGGIRKYLDGLGELGVGFEVLEHPELKAATDVQAYLGDTLAGSAQTLIMKAGEQFVAIIKRGDVRLDSKKIKKELGVSSLRMATDAEFGELTGLPVGAARVYNPGVPTLLDKSLFEKEYLNGGSGSFTVTIKYKTEDLKKIPNSKVVSLGETGIEKGGRKRILSGIRSSGMLHLGNYLGAVKGMLALQGDPQYETFYMVADLHALTTPYDKAGLAEATRSVVKDYLAAGLDPEKSVLFVQSQVPEHAELSYLFSTVTTLAKLTHLPTYKEKVKQYPEHSTLALVGYPVLMAADILVYRSGLVPVGVDQEPHLEMAREIARRMNADYGTDFPEPVRFAIKGEYVPSLAGEGKMSKSVEGSYIALTDDLPTIRAKLAKAPTDAGGPGDVPKVGPVANLFKFAELFLPARLEYYGGLYGQGKLKYSELKEELATAIYREIEPVQKKLAALSEDYVDKVIAEGAKKARKVAGETVAEVKKKMGLLI